MQVKSVQSLALPDICVQELKLNSGPNSGLIQYYISLMIELIVITYRNAIHLRSFIYLFINNHLIIS